MLRSVCLILFAGLSLGACVSGPKVSVYVVDHDSFVDKYGTVYTFEGHELDGKGIACTSPDDLYRILKECKSGAGAPDVLVCAWAQGTRTFDCGDASVRDAAAVYNWSCLSARDWNRYLTYCRRKVRGIASNLGQ